MLYIEYPKVLNVRITEILPTYMKKFGDFRKKSKERPVATRGTPLLCIFRRQCRASAIRRSERDRSRGVR